MKHSCLTSAQVYKKPTLHSLVEREEWGRGLILFIAFIFTGMK
jgi:hypothetical protein